MIGKLKKASSIAHLINYLYMDKQNARTLSANGVTTATKQGCAKCFEGHVEAYGR